MASLTFLAHNGIGLGHLRRTEVLAAAATDAGHAVKIFAQGFCPAYLHDRFPTENIQPLHKMSEGERCEFERRLIRHLRSQPEALLLEDTHPCQLRIPRDITRKLIVRPTRFEFLQEAYRTHRYDFDQFLLADSPASPTWPYNREQTQIVLNEWGWYALGPIFLRVSAIPYDERPRSLVISAGGGGQHQGGEDLHVFLAHGRALAQRVQQVDPAVRVDLFRGPYSSVTTDWPAWAHQHPYDAALPEWIGRARGAIVRPGYNSLWECLSSATPFQVVHTATYEEPIQERLAALVARGIQPLDLAEAWSRPHDLLQISKVLEELAGPFSGSPSPDAIAGLAQRPTARSKSRLARPAPQQRRILIITINGIGIGHVVRACRLGLALVQRGHQVELAIESRAPGHLHDLPLPFRILPRVTPSTSRPDGYLGPLQELIDQFDPEIVIEDTHVRPHPLAIFHPQLRLRHRFAIASLPSSEALDEWLARDDVEHVFLLHSEAEFAALYGAERATEVAAHTRARLAGGPLASGDVELNDALPVELPASPFVLWVLGGGGEHEGWDDMARVTSAICESVPELLGAGVESLVCTGPNYAYAQVLRDARIAHVDYAPNLDALMQAAQVVILRPGFNSSREAYSHAARILVLRTRQYREATVAHIDLLLQRRAVLACEVSGAAVARGVQELLPEPGGVGDRPLWSDATPTIADFIGQADCDASSARLFREAAQPIVARALFVRVDDVTSMPSRLSDFLATCVTRGIAVSLEVIPKCLAFSVAALHDLDPSGALLQVGQHGYTHRSRPNKANIKSEFKLGQVAPAACAHRIQAGRRALRDEFGTRFGGGFSAPYDSYPEWLGQYWSSIGGLYLSSIWARPKPGGARVVRANAETWDWGQNRRRSRASVLGDVLSGWYRRGHSGVVVHAQHLASPEYLHHLHGLLDVLCRGGAAWAVPSAIASSQAARVRVSTTRRYLSWSNP